MAEARERPILFSAPMVRAVLAGTKTQTRRVLAPQPWYGSRIPDGPHFIWPPGSGHRYEAVSSSLGKFYSLAPRQQAELAGRCPYGARGSRLWVREAWAAGACSEGLSPSCLSPQFYKGEKSDNTGLWYLADDARPPKPVTPRGRWRPSIHMPRWASRMTLEITDVRVQRLQEISGEEARREGIEYSAHVDGYLPGPHDDARVAFAELWDELNADRGYPWERNPWVWAISFRRIA